MTHHFILQKMIMNHGIWQIKAGFVQAPTTHKAPAHQDDRKVPRKGKLGAKRPQQEGALEQQDNKKLK
jgi:hypothetical protein